jgi:succinate dehydrogenase/fumarate reductase flavoprotein subunit
MDFLHNPVGEQGWDEFSIDGLGEEALEYLEKTGAKQELPIDRLRHMNQPAIDIYSENNIDLTAKPLEIAVCSQHMNGGFAVNKWWESSIPRTFVIGEMAGTHGVKRPGGSALNAGQVGASRAAEYITSVYSEDAPSGGEAEEIALQAVAGTTCLKKLLETRDSAPISAAEAMDEIGERMTRCGAHLRSRTGVAGALEQAKKQYADLREKGMRFERLSEAVAVLQQCLTQIAILKAQAAMFDRKVGSRGSHCILDSSGIEMHPALIDPENNEPYRFIEENEDLRNEILCISYDPEAEDLFTTRIVEPRPMPDRDIAFEPAWAEYREGEIYNI